MCAHVGRLFVVELKTAIRNHNLNDLLPFLFFSGYTKAGSAVSIWRPAMFLALTDRKFKWRFCGVPPCLGRLDPQEWIAWDDLDSGDVFHHRPIYGAKDLVEFVDLSSNCDVSGGDNLAMQTPLTSSQRAATRTIH